MSVIPIWQAGKTYVPGSLVVPSSGTITVASQPENADFETGDLSGWTDASGMFGSNTFKPYSGSYCASATGGGAGQMTSNTTFPVTAGSVVQASSMVRLTNSGKDDTSGQLNIVWLDADGSVISTTEGSSVHKHGGSWKQSNVSGSAPSGVASYQLALVFDTGSHGGSVAFDKVTLTYAYGGPPQGLAYKAVQSAAGKSGNAEPAWPAVLGQTVVDNEVTWEAVIGNLIIWQASPIMKSGDVEPTWPASPDAAVHDGTIDWIASTAQITDSNCPRSKIVAIAASKVYVADNDIIRYCATVNPLDWTSANDAGFLDFGLQTYGSNPVAAMNLYRSNLVAFNAEGFQMWQVDPDPASITLLDAMPIASTYNLALSPVANDLLFLSSQGVRSVGISATSSSLQAGDVGMPIDALVKAAMADASAGDQEPLSTFLPALGQFWIAFNAADRSNCTVFVYTINQIGQVGKWSRYVFPFPIDDFTQLDDDLYMRSGDAILRYDDDALNDCVGAPDGSGLAETPFPGVVQYHWLDLQQPGVTKQLLGFDLVASGADPSVAIGYDESNPSAYTADFTVPADTVPGMIIPMCVMAPSMSLRISYPGGAKWRVLAANLYLQDQRPMS